MFGKIFTQIFDSSLADNPQTRWVFMDLLVLADQNGVVDMTREAISRRTNVPLKIVATAMKELESPDTRSRSNDFEGVRLKRLDDHRDWGWVIVNYSKYRAIANAEAYRQVTREKVQAIRERERKSPPAPPLPKAEAKAEAYSGDVVHVITGNNKRPKTGKKVQEITVPASINTPEFLKAWAEWNQHRVEKKKPQTSLSCQKQLSFLESIGTQRAIAAINYSIEKGWEGIYESKDNGSKTSQRNSENPRNIGVCVAGPSIADQVALKIQRQNEKCG